MKIKELIKKLKQKINNLKNLSRRQKRKYVKIGFFIFGLLLFLNISIMTMYLIDKTYNYKIFNNAYTQAVYPGQSLDQSLKLRVVKYKKVALDDIEIGDEVIVDGDFNLDVYWVETVVSVDHITKTIKTSYDYEVASTYREDAVVGIYLNDANFFGTIYFASSFLKGFIFIAITQGILLYSYYFILINKEE